MPAATSVVPPTTNILQYLAYLEAAVEYGDLQLARARAEIASLKQDIARYTTISAPRHLEVAR